MEDLKSKTLENVRMNDVKFINLQFTDILGSIKSVAIPVERLADAMEDGVWFDGSSVEGFARIHESDMILMPDPSTYALVPWRPKPKAEARMFADVLTPNMKPFDGDPRFILKQVTERVKKMGFTLNTGAEIEFFLLKRDDNLKPIPHDVGGYFDYSARDLATDVRRNIIFTLEEFGITVEMGHHEVAHGQHEIDIRYSNVLSNADNIITAKHVIKSVANVHGLYATFMPKPFFGINGSGMHTHQSFFKDGENAFFSESDTYNLSETAYHFIAGQLEHAKEICAIVAPTVNSYKRLVPGYEAPVYICWAQANRSALIRIPKITKERRQSTRAELRCPDPSCNPYLAFAVMLEAGLDGVRRKLQPPQPVEEDVYEFDDAKLEKFYIKTLPSSLGEAIAEVQKSKLVEEVLGKHAFNAFLRAKKLEWDQYRIHVTDWEINRLLEIL